ncbi:uncharacterized protein LOC131681454 [Topomyia yanbarensis]|uniref:uncharacterized protein LOC131681454 n=1 Tax=Topomyia yanbarensis TaxID=2498891 RepID=UPI00273B0257|nr:uncharacterized protein LOC131681454 [Topomyia yanbarensis]
MPRLLPKNVYSISGDSDIDRIMVNEDKLQLIPQSEWIDLRDIYKVDWPKHEMAYNTIQNYINWVKIDSRIKHLKIYSLSDSWRDNGTYIIVDRYQMFFYSIEESNESLGRALRLIDWDYSYKICYIRKCHRSALDLVLKSASIELQWETFTYLYHLPKEESLKFEINLPDGLRLKRLQAEHAITANNIWPHRCEGSEYFLKRLAVWNISIGLFNESDKLVAWCFCWQTGAMGPLEVAPEHLRKGYGTIMVKAIARELANNGLNCYGTVLCTNKASQGMFEKLGFKRVDGHYYVRNQPRKLVEWAC